MVRKKHWTHANWSCLAPPSQFFVLDVYNSDGSPLTVDQIYMQLEKIWNSSLQTNKEPIGILTSQHRNTWGKAYNNLIKGEERRHKNGAERLSRTP